MTNTKEHWDDRYKNKGLELSNPETFLKDSISLLKQGSMLDIACGDGCNSIFLAQQGFEVTGVDISSIALSRLKSFALKQNLAINTLCTDVEKNDDLSQLNQFDSILICRYKPTDDFLNSIPDLLTLQGTLVLITFNTKTLATRDFPEKFCLQPGELKNKKWALTLIKYQETSDAHGIFDAYIFKNI